jgi:hypothetical protein
MLLPARIRHIVYALTAAGWLVVILAACPLGDWITQDQRSLAVLVAAVGSVKIIVRRILAPAHELFAAGKIIGRAEALAELDTDVVRLDERRALRVVTSEPTAGQG